MQKGKLQYSHLAIAILFSIIVSLYCHAKLGSDWWEVSGFITGILAVYLTAKEHMSNWPIGIVNVLLYAYVFYASRLFADMTLQFFFFALSIHGWYSWAKGGTQKDTLKISRLQPVALAVCIGALIVGTAIYVPIITHFKGASPFLDSLLTVASIIAQILLNRKVLENWILWIVIDVLYIPLYYSRGLYPTTILYVIFLGLAIGGLVQWLKNHRENLIPTFDVNQDLSNYPRA